VNWPLLNRIAQLEDQELTVVGDNPIELSSGISYKPAIMDRRALAKEMTSHERLIFTSPVDYFPLTIAEALTAGLEVLALDSRAAREFEGHRDVKIASSEESLMRMVEARPERPAVDAAQRSQSEFFNPQRMTLEYMDVYRRLTNS
jgi:putative colanic acid biosynthesis glycosyltransferase